MQVIFVIQGEGRGHLSQALALKEQLDRRGVLIQAVIIGKNGSRSIPDYFREKINAPIIQLASPSFVFDSKMKGINLPATILKNIRNLPQFFKSVRKLSDILRQYNPKLVINFYEPLIAISKLLNRNPYPVFSIAHQFIFEHSQYVFPKGFIADKISIINYTKFISKGSIRKFALSLYSLNDIDQINLNVIPPLLRESVTNLKVEKTNIVLVYILNEGYLGEVLNLKLNNPTYEIHCFTDKKNLEQDLELEPGLWLHKINDVQFLELMSKCCALFTTAGFESIAEAMYLTKPIVMIPVKGHFEQYCNSRDAFRAGAGFYAETFNSHSISSLIENYNMKFDFKQWYLNNKNILVDEILEFIKLKDYSQYNFSLNKESKITSQSYD